MSSPPWTRIRSLYIVVTLKYLYMFRDTFEEGKRSSRVRHGRTSPHQQYETLVVRQRINELKRRECALHNFCLIVDTPYHLSTTYHHEPTQQWRLIL